MQFLTNLQLNYFTLLILHWQTTFYKSWQFDDSWTVYVKYLFSLHDVIVARVLVRCIKYTCINIPIMPMALFPPASAVEGIKSVPSVCLFVCPSVTGNDSLAQTVSPNKNLFPQSDQQRGDHERTKLKSPPPYERGLNMIKVTWYMHAWFMKYMW